MKYQSLRELFIVTEWKDDCIYIKTKSIGLAYVTLDYKSSRGLVIASLSTSISKQLTVKHLFRKVEDNIPDIVRVHMQFPQDGPLTFTEIKS